MTFEEMVSLYAAKKSGRDRWRAYCPVHQGKSRSLSIRPGKICSLLWCFGGCSQNDVLAAKGLTIGDTYYQAFTLTAKSAREVAYERMGQEWERTRRAGKEYRQHRENTQLLRQARIWEAVVGALGRRLAANPDDDVLAFYFDRALEESRAASQAADQLFHPVLRDAPPLYRGSLRGITAHDVGPTIAEYLQLPQLEPEPWNLPHTEK